MRFLDFEINFNWFDTVVKKVLEVIKLILLIQFLPSAMGDMLLQVLQDLLVLVLIL